MYGFRDLKPKILLSSTLEVFSTSVIEKSYDAWKEEREDGHCDRCHEVVLDEPREGDRVWVGKEERSFWEMGVQVLCAGEGVHDHCTVVLDGGKSVLAHVVNVVAFSRRNTLS